MRAWRRLPPPPIPTPTQGTYGDGLLCRATSSTHTTRTLRLQHTARTWGKALGALYCGGNQLPAPLERVRELARARCLLHKVATAQHARKNNVSVVTQCRPARGYFKKNPALCASG